jgi:hypothetical protein
VSSISTFPAAAMLHPLVAAGVLYDDPPHRLRCGSKEVAARIPSEFVTSGLGSRSSDQPEIGFVNQRRRLQGLPWRLGSHSGGGELPQFVVHDRQQLVGRPAVARGCGFE